MWRRSFTSLTVPYCSPLTPNSGSSFSFPPRFLRKNFAIKKILFLRSADVDAFRRFRWMSLFAFDGDNNGRDEFQTETTILKYCTVKTVFIITSGNKSVSFWLTWFTFSSFLITKFLTRTPKTNGTKSVAFEGSRDNPVSNGTCDPVLIIVWNGKIDAMISFLSAYNNNMSFDYCERSPCNASFIMRAFTWRFSRERRLNKQQLIVIIQTNTSVSRWSKTILSLTSSRMLFVEPLANTAYGPNRVIEKHRAHCFFFHCWMFSENIFKYMHATFILRIFFFKFYYEYACKRDNRYVLIVRSVYIFFIFLSTTRQNKIHIIFFEYTFRHESVTRKKKHLMMTCGVSRLNLRAQTNRNERNRTNRFYRTLEVRT